MKNATYPELPLEDFYEDILGKSMRGLELSPEKVATAAAISVENFKKALNGTVISEDIQKLASVLKLNPIALEDCAHKSWKPRPVAKLDGFEMDATPWHSMMVNSYLVWDPKTLKAAFFDSGASAIRLIELANSKKLKVEHIFLTHTHGDHIADVDRILKETSAQNIFACSLEPFPDADLFDPGTSWRLGELEISSRLTCGHSIGGITYIIKGLKKRLAVVGDAVFAGSMGGGKVSFENALKTAKSEIMTLEDATVLAPGHGPLTTVGEEKSHNPFLAE